MRIVVIGANGATGRAAVFDGLARGHEMVAFVRDSARVTLTDPLLTVVQGDVFGPVSVRGPRPDHAPPQPPRSSYWRQACGR